MGKKEEELKKALLEKLATLEKVQKPVVAYEYDRPTTPETAKKKLDESLTHLLPGKIAIFTLWEGEHPITVSYFRDPQGELIPTRTNPPIPFEKISHINAKFFSDEKNPLIKLLHTLLAFPLTDVDLESMQAIIERADIKGLNILLPEIEAIFQKIFKNCSASQMSILRDAWMQGIHLAYHHAPEPLNLTQNRLTKIAEIYGYERLIPGMCRALIVLWMMAKIYHQEQQFFDTLRMIIYGAFPTNKENISDIPQTTKAFFDKVDLLQSDVEIQVKSSQKTKRLPHLPLPFFEEHYTFFLEATKQNLKQLAHKISRLAELPPQKQAKTFITLKFGSPEFEANVMHITSIHFDSEKKAYIFYDPTARGELTFQDPSKLLAYLQEEYPGIERILLSFRSPKGFLPLYDLLFARKKDSPKSYVFELPEELRLALTNAKSDYEKGILRPNDFFKTLQKAADFILNNEKYLTLPEREKLMKIYTDFTETTDFYDASSSELPPETELVPK